MLPTKHLTRAVQLELSLLGLLTSLAGIFIFIGTFLDPRGSIYSLGYAVSGMLLIVSGLFLVFYTPKK